MTTTALAFLDHSSVEQSTFSLPQDNNIGRNFMLLSKLRDGSHVANFLTNILLPVSGGGIIMQHSSYQIENLLRPSATPQFRYIY